MKVVIGVAAVIGTAIFATSVLLDDSSAPREGTPLEHDRQTRAPTQTPRFGGALERCSTRSEANFPGAFTDPRNLVVGPLVLIGGAYTPASTVREFGGNKFPLLVVSGHRVTVRLTRRARRIAGLAYGPLRQGRRTRMRDTYRTVTFAACRPGPAPARYSPDGPSGSSADGTAVTFWSGFVLTRTPACLALEVYVDDARSPRRVGLPLGRRCGGEFGING